MIQQQVDYSIRDQHVVDYPIFVNQNYDTISKYLIIDDVSFTIILTRRHIREEIKRTPR